MNGPNCGDCQFWLQNGEGSHDGFCRRFPPQIPTLVNVDSLTGPRPVPISFFPPMRAEGWCGEYKFVLTNRNLD